MDEIDETEVTCSVIVPTVGRETLERAVKSVLEQGLPRCDYEIIVVNDSNQPLRLSPWLEQQGVHVIEANKSGLNFACNTGAVVAKGRYLKFLHDDDYLLPGGLCALINRADESRAVLVVGGERLVDDNGVILRHIERPGLSGNIFAFFVVGEVLHVSDCLISRRAFMDVGGFDPNIKISEDRDLGCRLSLFGNVASANHLVACVRIAGSEGSTYDFSNIIAFSRLVRERAFDSTGSFARISDSVKSSDYMRGRVFRSYLFSAALNLLAGKIWLTGSRLTCGLRAANWHAIKPSFWRGVFHRRVSHQA